MSDRLLSQLNQSKTTAADKPLWQVIKQLIDKIHALENAAGNSSTNIITNETIIQQFLLGGEDSDGGGGDIVPGPQGIKGDTGNTGAVGPPFPSFISIESDEPEQPLPIPGPQGIQGPTGSTGPVGPTAYAFIPADEIYPDDIAPIPGPQGIQGASGSSAVWILVATQVAAGAANYDFTGLSAYSEFIIVLDGIVLSASSVASLLTSVNNGSTWLGNYFNVTANGTVGSNTEMPFYNLNSTAARYSRFHIEFANTACVYKTGIAYSGTNWFIPTSSAINALRVQAVGANLNSGTIYVLAR